MALESGCTAKLASINHLMMPSSSILNVKNFPLVPFKYINNLFNFFQSDSFGFFTRVDKTATAKCISGLDLLDANNPFATLV